MNGKKVRQLRSLSKTKKEYRQLKKKFYSDLEFRKSLYKKENL